jgi:CPA2 family monovalent cation:H+ antiporter-2
VTIIVRISGVDLRSALRTGMILAVGGEFGFALLALGLEGQIIDTRSAQIVLNAVFFSMVLAPLLIRFNQPLSRLLAGRSRPRPAVTETEEPASSAAPAGQQGQIVICGFGRIGQVVARFLEREKLPYVALDIDPVIVREARMAAQPVFFGDSADISVLESAGLAGARLVIVSHDDLTAALKTIKAARTLNPAIPIVARTRDETHMKELVDAGATEIIPETLEAGMMIALHAMMFLQVPTWRVADYLQEQRSSRYEMVRELFRGRFGIWKSIDGDHRQRLHSILLDDSSPAVGGTLGEADTALPDITITTLVRSGQRLQNPSPGLELQTGDVLVLMGNSQALDQAESHLTGSSPS